MMKDISLEEAVDLTINQWKWYGEYTGTKIKRLYFSSNDIKVEPLYYCYLCEALIIKDFEDNIKLDCNKCPFAAYQGAWKEGYYCCKPGSPYKTWMDADDDTGRLAAINAIINMLIKFKMESK